MAYNSRVETLINVKIRYEDLRHKFKLPLRDLVPSTLQDKLCQLLEIPKGSKAVFERYSDSSKTYVVLDPNNVSSYQQLYRAARAKLRLRLRVSIINKGKEIINKSSTNDDNNSLPVISPLPGTPNRALPATKDMAPSTTKSAINSNIGSSLNDIQQSFQKLHLNDHVRNIAKVDNVNETPIETKSNRLTAAINSQIAKKIEYSKIPKNTDESYIFRHNPCYSHDLSTLNKYLSGKNNRKDIEKDMTPSISADLYTLTVICNNCNSLISGEHYHCSNCDGGDFDLCQACINNGTSCYGEHHWLIKRFIKNGEPVNSITQTVTPKCHSQSKQIEKDIKNEMEIRTCNCCIAELTEDQFVTCTTCTDYDLCISCHVNLNHGHHPKHAFEPVIKDQKLNATAQILLAPGRNVEHSATCDGCDKVIYGIRHKCLDCPDWDYCSTCIVDAKTSHPRHRFVPIYEKFDLLELEQICPINGINHYGVFCDGPHCKNISSYIKGDRYKCTICDDTDFCARCEASTQNIHDPTHPLIKLKFPVEKVSVETYNDSCFNKSTSVMSDDKIVPLPTSEETSSAPSTNAEIQVQTIFDLKPLGLKENGEELTNQSSCEIKDPSIVSPLFEPKIIAQFIRDSIIDGTIMLPNVSFEQTWYLRNAGKNSWPSGCYIKFVSGTNMCFVENKCLESTPEQTLTSRSIALNSEVAPGETVGFTVLLRTPCSPGNYISFWRLIAPDDRVVGPKLWCEINVEDQIPSSENKITKEKSLETSKMIFPTLQKETILTTYDQESVVQDLAEEDFEELSEENFSDEDSLDFAMTDDEYDILDASDGEYLEESKR
ncbi:hypothetical protein HI914_03692 [Erysiphe necator]|nr:hypothetical protein HI914_03692 [Erysiphe necator]